MACSLSPGCAFALSCSSLSFCAGQSGYHARLCQRGHLAERLLARYLRRLELRLDLRLRRGWSRWFGLRGIVIEEFRRSHHTRRRRNVSASACERRIEDSLVVWRERPLQGLLVFGQKIDAQLVGVFHEVAARMPVAFGELIEELLEADFDPCHQHRLIAAGNRDLLVDGLLERLPDVRKHRLVLPRPAAGIWRWTAFLPPLVRRRRTGANLVRFGRSALRSVGLRFQRLAVCGIGFFGHVTDPRSSRRRTRFAQ